MAKAAEGDTYNFDWLDPDKEVYVLQNRKFRKNGRLYFNGGAAITTSGAFVDSWGMQARAGYFAKEAIGFEFIYSKNQGKENDTARSVRGKRGQGGTIPFRRIVDNYLGAMVMWSPFYSKTNTFNQVIYLDWLFGVGYAKLEETNNVLELDLNNSKKPTTLNHGGLIWNAGAKIFLSRYFDIRLDLTAVHYKAFPGKDQSKKIWYSNWDAAISIGFSL